MQSLTQWCCFKKCCYVDESMNEWEGKSWKNICIGHSMNRHKGSPFSLTRGMGPSQGAPREDGAYAEPCSGAGVGRWRRHAL